MGVICFEKDTNRWENTPNHLPLIFNVLLYLNHAKENVADCTNALEPVLNQLHLKICWNLPRVCSIKSGRKHWYNSLVNLLLLFVLFACFNFRSFAVDRFDFDGFHLDGFRFLGFNFLDSKFFLFCFNQQDEAKQEQYKMHNGLAGWYIFTCTSFKCASVVCSVTSVSDLKHSYCDQKEHSQK